MQSAKLLRNSRKTDSLRLLEISEFLQILEPRLSGLCAFEELAQNGAPAAVEISQVPGSLGGAAGPFALIPNKLTQESGLINIL